LSMDDPTQEAEIFAAIFSALMPLRRPLHQIPPKKVLIDGSLKFAALRPQ
jgi:hypothetical protein